MFRRGRTQRAGGENRLAEERTSGENLARKALTEGMSTTEAFAKYGIL